MISGTSQCRKENKHLLKSIIRGIIRPVLSVALILIHRHLTGYNSLKCKLHVTHTQYAVSWTHKTYSKKQLFLKDYRVMPSRQFHKFHITAFSTYAVQRY